LSLHPGWDLAGAQDTITGKPAPLRAVLSGPVVASATAMATNRLEVHCRHWVIRCTMHGGARGRRLVCAVGGHRMQSLETPARLQSPGRAAP